MNFYTGQISLEKLGNYVVMLESSRYDKNLDILNIKNIVKDFNALDDKREKKLKRIK